MKEILTAMKAAIVAEAETKLCRPMTNAEKMGLENQSLSMLDSISMELHFAESEEQMEVLLKSLIELGKYNENT